MKKLRGVRIAGNWKMNHGLKATEAFFSELGNLAKTQVSAPMAESMKKRSLRATLFPPTLSLETASRVVAQFSAFPIEIGAQNALGEKSGAFTGETSGPMLDELRVRAALVGHSERRQLFGETDDTARKRVEGLLSQGFDVILCVGETRAERESGNTEAVLERQLKAALSPAVVPYCDGRLTIAYEPVWAIGTGLNATPEQAEAAQKFVRETVASVAGKAAGKSTVILYGGSVTPENAASLISCANVDGCLVGGASLKPESYLKLLSAGFAAL